MTFKGVCFELPDHRWREITKKKHTEKFVIITVNNIVIIIIIIVYVFFLSDDLQLPDAFQVIIIIFFENLRNLSASFFNHVSIIVISI